MRLGCKGQGTVGAWITGVIGMAVTITVFIVFHQILWSEDMGLAHTLNQSVGLDLGSTAMTTLMTTWEFWPVAFIFAWIIYMVVYSIIREPQQGYR